LGKYAKQVLSNDLLGNQSISSVPRSDRDRFFVECEGEKELRIPVSYLIKLAMADALNQTWRTRKPVWEIAEKIMRRFLSDNTSPESSSFHIVSLHPHHGNGKAVSREVLRRFFLTQILVSYANRKFGLSESGQKAKIFFSPHPPIRQKFLNNCISDAFYRELFMSPCLNWKDGEAKHRYMNLCHEVLSRSQLNAVGKLREAGIITRNLVVLPNPSNISLANNGVHISFGSQLLTSLLSDPGSGFRSSHEKLLGDLVIKITEHFLSLFVGTYSASPYRLSFSDFHPECVLGFLPHELDYTHLRMLWRRWKKKARNKILNHSFTPFGPEAMDNLISWIFRLKGDLIADFRLLDYPVSLLSTQRSPSLNGVIGSDERLKRDLTAMGVFDSRMSLYLMYKLREFSRSGFSGFEARYFSLFESFENDFSKAVELQSMITALAFQLIVKWKLTHSDIPDTPFVESERRQVFFAQAVGIPTFYVSKRTGNQLLRRILARTKRIRSSARYPGYFRVIIQEYHRALISIIEEEGRELTESLQVFNTINDLKARLEDGSQLSAFNRITRCIIGQVGKKSAFKLGSDEFNCAAESYYRDELRIRHIKECFQSFKVDLSGLVKNSESDLLIRELLPGLIPLAGIDQSLDELQLSFLEEKMTTGDLRKLIHLILLLEYGDSLKEPMRG
jgi:hypothetical protein